MAPNPHWVVWTANGGHERLWADGHRRLLRPARVGRSENRRAKGPAGQIDGFFMNLMMRRQ